MIATEIIVIRVLGICTSMHSNVKLLKDYGIGRRRLREFHLTQIVDVVRSTEAKRNPFFVARLHIGRVFLIRP